MNERQEKLIPAREAMARLGLTNPNQLKRLVDNGQLRRVSDERFKNRMFYVEDDVEVLAEKWREFQRHYIIVA